MYQLGEFVPGAVYVNLVKMMTNYREIVLNSEPLSNDVLAQKLNHYEHVTITGKREDKTLKTPADVTTILIAPESNAASKSADFKKLLKSLPDIKANKACELIFVSKDSLTNHIKKYLIQFRAKNPQIYVEDLSYNIFLIETPKHVLVPLHVRATDEEVAELCSTHYFSKDRLPKILASDPQAVWLGLRPGSVVKIYRASETAGHAWAYRICVRG